MSKKANNGLPFYLQWGKPWYEGVFAALVLIILGAVLYRVEMIYSIASRSDGGSQNITYITSGEKVDVKTDKYHAILLTKEIMDDINQTKNYAEKFDELRLLLNGAFPDQLAEIEKYKEMKILSHDEIVDIVDGVTKDAYENNPDMKCRPAVIDSVVKNLREKNEWEALKIIEKVEPQNEDLKKVMENLNVRNILKYYINTIAEEILKNG